MGLRSSVAPLACLASSWASSSPPTDNSRCKHASGETLRCVEQRRTTSNSVELHHLSRIDCVTLHYIAYVVLRCITLYYVILRYITLYCVVLRCIALHCVASTGTEPSSIPGSIALRSALAVPLRCRIHVHVHAGYVKIDAH